MDGSKTLIEQLIHATGLPEGELQTVVDRLFLEAKIDKKKATLDEIRFVLTNYLLDVFLEISNKKIH